MHGNTSGARSEIDGILSRRRRPWSLVVLRPSLSLAKDPQGRRSKVEGLFPSFRQPPFRGAVVVVILRINLSHRRVARAFFVRVRDETREP